MKQNPKSESGFTLLELLVSLALIAVLLTTSVMIVRLATASREAGTQKADVYQRLRVLHERLHSTLRSAHLVFVNPAESKSLIPDEDEKQSGNPKILAFEGKEDSLRFVTFNQKLMESKDMPSMHEVHFYLHKNEETGSQEILLNERDFSPEHFFNPDTPGQKPGQTLRLAQDVAYLSFQYHYKISEEGKPQAPEDEKSVKVSSEQTDKITTEPFVFKSDNKDDKSDVETGESVRIPEAVEVTIGLWKPTRFEENSEPEMAALPSILIPIQTGKVFARFKDEEDENKNSTQE